jgi:polyhydroxyalkanoate synthesis regulator phasin
MKLLTTALVFLAAAVLAGYASDTFAQQERDQIELMLAQIRTNRQAIVTENLDLTAAESDVFWPLYRQFQNDRATMVDRTMKMLTEFRDNFDVLSEEQAKALVDEYFKIQKEELRLNEKYLREFRKILSQKKTLRYFQIENKLDAIIDYDLSQVIPLALAE